MVTDNHYRWDFIQLADDPKPTPATSFKVTDGSTLYTSDDSKLYVWYKDQWYEKASTGGGGGIPTTVVDTIWFGTQAEYDAIVTKAEKTLYLVQEEITTANTLSASPTVLTLPKINLEKANILNNVVTPEEEIEEPEDPQVVETEVVEEPEEVEEPQIEEPEVEELQAEEPEEVEEKPEEEETKESEE